MISTQQTPAGSPSTTGQPSRPSPSSHATPSGASKPRLLYRGPLRLTDGTLLKGVAFVSTVDPFAAPDNAATSAGAGADDADICLALEMARGRSTLGIEQVDEATMPSTSAGCDVRLEASGRIKMFIDPNEPLTAAYFERNFCWGDDWSDEGKERSRTAFLLSTGTASTLLATSIDGNVTADAASQSQDPFMSSYASKSAAPLPLVERRSAALQLVLFARMGEGDSVLDVVVGRRVVQKRSKAAAAGGGQARGMSQGLRPDDPLPRVAAAAALQDPRQKTTREGEEESTTAASASGSTTWRKTASAPNLARPLLPPARPSSGSASDRGGDRSLASVMEASSSQEQQEPASSKTTSVRGESSSSSAAHGMTGGNHTPGRRGEKRRSTASVAANSRRGPEHLLSPSKRRRTTVAGLPNPVVPTRPPPLTLQPPRPPPTQRRRSAASPTPMPEPPPSATLAAPSAMTASSSKVYTALELKNRSVIKKLVQHQLLGRGLERRRDPGDADGLEDGEDAEDGPTATDDGGAGDEGEEEDFDRLFHGAYTSTCVALRRDLSRKAIRRDVAAKVVRWHLDLYLEAGEDIGGAVVTSGGTTEG